METIKPERMIKVVGDQNYKTVQALIDQVFKMVNEKPQEWINLIVNSSGGLIDPGFAFYDFIIGVLRPKIQSIALGAVSSMAIVFFLSGEQRLIGRNTQVRFHEFGRTMSKEERYTAREFKTAFEDLKTSQDRYTQILVERTGGRLTVKKVLDMMIEEVNLGAKEAVELELPTR